VPEKGTYSLEEFGKRLKEFESKLEQANSVVATTVELYKKQQDECHHVAKDGLLLIEEMLRKVSNDLKYDKPGGTWGNYLAHLKLIGFIKSELYSSLWDLKLLRNVVFHSSAVIIQHQKTKMILETCKSLLEVLIAKRDQ